MLCKFKINVFQNFVLFFLKKLVSNAWTTSSTEIYLKTHLYKNKTILFFLKKSYFFNIKSLVDLIIIDRPENNKRFNIVYVGSNFIAAAYIYISFWSQELNNVYSVSKIFDSANWLEREAWDLFGIYFQHHIALKKLLNDYGFNGFPLRKTFPLSGFYEVNFTDISGRLTNRKIQFVQMFRKLKN